MSRRYPALLFLLALAGISPGYAAPLGPWLHFGPVAVDVTKEFEHLQIYGLDRAGAKLRPDQDQDALRLASSAPTEGASANLFGATSTWRLLRLQPPARLATWAQFGRFPVLLANALQTNISSPAKRVRASFEIAGGARIFLNGTPVYQYNWPNGRYAQRRRHTVDLDLREGPNSLVVVIFAIHLHAANAFYAESSDPVQASVHWNDPSGLRAEMEKDLARTYAGPWLARSGRDPITAGISGPPSRFAIEFRAPAWKRTLPAGTRELALGDAASLLNGRTAVTATVQAPGGFEITGPAFTLQRAEPPPSVDPNWSLDQRRQYILDAAARSSAPARRALARAALGQTISLADLRDALAHVNNRIDTADFVFHDLIRLYYQFPSSLQPDARDAIKAAALDFKYWMDEPGPSSMFMKSENHQILFNSLQFLTGTLFPASHFREIGAPGTVQALKGRTLSAEWIDERLRFGFEEWLAPGYLEKDVQAMLNIVDLPNDDARLASSAQSLLDMIFTFLCSHEWGGYMHTTAGRAYMRDVTTPYMQSVASLIWYLTGKGAAEVDSGSLYLALSKYRPPAQILALSNPDGPSLTYTQQGRGRNGAGVNTVTLRAPHHMLSTTLDLTKGASGPQAHIVQATLPGGIPVFINAAISTSEVTRPGFWLGNTELPRAFQFRDTAILLYRLKDPVAFSHCFLPLPWMDRHLARGNWIAAQKGDGYVAVYSQSGHTLTASGPYRDFETVAASPSNVWILKVGARAIHPTLEAFLASLPEPSFANGQVSFGSLKASWEGPFTNQGAAVAVSGLPLIGNERVKSTYGAGAISVTHPRSGTLSISR